MSILSLVSLLVSILGVVIYGSLFNESGVTWIFVLLSIVSLLLPPIAKKVRISCEKTGEVPEVFAIIVGGFNFYCVIFALTTLPIFFGYLGWVVSGIVYKAVNPEARYIHYCAECKSYHVCTTDSKETICSCPVCKENMTSLCISNAVWKRMTEKEKNEIKQRRGLYVDPNAQDISNKTEAIVVDKPVVQYCRKCGYKLLEDSVFCSRCGTEIIKE